MRAPSRGSRVLQLAVVGACAALLVALLWPRSRPKRSSKDTVLNLLADPEIDDAIYRILREYEDGRVRIVYVLLNASGVIPREDFSQTFGPSVITHLSKLKEWNGEWTTMAILPGKHTPEIQLDPFRPHRVAGELVYNDYSSFDFLELQEIVMIKDRTGACFHNEQPCYVKLAQFDFQIPALEREIRAYRHLATRQSALAPKMLGYVYEDTKDRVIGVLIEEITGRFPTLDDLEACREALSSLHTDGIVHGDGNQYNIIMTDNGVKFIDFEASKINDDTKDWKDRAKMELDGLETKWQNTPLEAGPCL